jgi:phytoene desaturase
MKEELSKFGKENSTHYKAYLAEVKRLYETAEEQFFYRLFSSPRDYVSPSLFKALCAVRPLETMNYFHARYFPNEYVRMAFNRYATYIGSSPYVSPATFALIGHLELNDGVYYVEGGNTKIAEGFAHFFKKLGGRILNNTEVKQIFTKEKKAKGVLLQNEEIIEGEKVIVNGDLLSSYERLLPEEERPSYKDRKIASYEPSVSAFVMMVALKGRRKNFVHHQVYFSENYQREFEDIFVHKKLPEDPTIYIRTPLTAIIG